MAFGYNNNRQVQNGYWGRGYQHGSQSSMLGHFGHNSGHQPNTMGRGGYHSQQQMPSHHMPGRPPHQMPPQQMQGRQMQQMPTQQMPRAPALPINNARMPMQAPPAQQAPQTPQAAQPNIFQRPLPDGVTVQPLDEKTLASLKNMQPGTPLPNIGPPDAPLLEAATPPQAPIPALTPAQSEANIPRKALEQLMQNEHNAGKFYQYLESIAPHREYKTMLKDIVSCCNGRKASLNGLYNNMNGADFNTAEREIDTNMGFNEGVLRAIREESQGLRELSTIYETTTDDKSLRVLNAQMTRKLGGLAVLNAIYR